MGLRLFQIRSSGVAAIRRSREETLKSRRACPEHSEGSKERDLRCQALSAGRGARRHGARLGLRTLVTLHVGSALELKAERFWTFDERQKRLARTVGLKTA